MKENVPALISSTLGRVEQATSIFNAALGINLRIHTSFFNFHHQKVPLPVSVSTGSERIIEKKMLMHSQKPQAPSDYSCKTSLGLLVDHELLLCYTCDVQEA